MIPLFDLKAQYESIKPEIDSAINRVMSSGHYIGGEEVERFENEVCSMINRNWAVGVASGTDALIIALRACDIGPGDEVIVPAFSFWATASAVIAVGAKPVFVDVDLTSAFTINAYFIEEKITDKTKAIIPVHLFGNTADMRRIMAIASKHGLAVIEDAAQAFRGVNKDLNAFAGAMGNVGCFSFFPTKPLGCAGDGGMIVTNDYDIYRKARKLRSHGWVDKYQPEMIGYNSRLDAIQAAILRVKLHYVFKWFRQRKEIASLYQSIFSANNIRFFYEPEWSFSAHHLFMISAFQHRAELISKLKERGIETGVYYPRILPNCAPALRFVKREDQFYMAQSASEWLLAIPCYAEMTNEQVNEVASAVVEHCERHG